MLERDKESYDFWRRQREWKEVVKLGMRRLLLEERPEKNGRTVKASIGRDEKGRGFSPFTRLAIMANQICLFFLLFFFQGCKIPNDPLLIKGKFPYRPSIRQFLHDWLMGL